MFCFLMIELEWAKPIHSVFLQMECESNRESYYHLQGIVDD